MMRMLSPGVLGGLQFAFVPPACWAPAQVLDHASVLYATKRVAVVVVRTDSMPQRFLHGRHVCSLK